MENLLSPISRQHNRHFEKKSEDMQIALQLK